jgi:hypothetical protein
MATPPTTNRTKLLLVLVSLTLIKRNHDPSNSRRRTRIQEVFLVRSLTTSLLRGQRSRMGHALLSSKTGQILCQKNKSLVQELSSSLWKSFSVGQLQNGCPTCCFLRIHHTAAIAARPTASIPTITGLFTSP